MESKHVLPQDAKERKELPLARGLLDYFSAALAEVAHVSKVGNDQHNPGEEMHWAREKSGDHADCILRHIVDRGGKDKDGLRHSAKVAWRALALLQEELEAEGAPPSRASRFPGQDKKPAQVEALVGSMSAALQGLGVVTIPIGVCDDVKRPHEKVGTCRNWRKTT